MKQLTIVSPYNNDVLILKNIFFFNEDSDNYVLDGIT